jgi:hypothetical protein
MMGMPGSEGGSWGWLENGWQSYELSYVSNDCIYPRPEHEKEDHGKGVTASSPCLPFFDPLLDDH